MSRLPKREKLDPVQASAIDFVVAQEGKKKVERVVEVEMVGPGREMGGVDMESDNIV